MGLVGDVRLPSAPDVPLIRDYVPNFTSAPNGWSAIFAPAGTEMHIIAKLNRDINEVLSDPVVQNRLAMTHNISIGGTPEDLAAKLKEEAKMADHLAVRMGVK